MQYYRQYQNIGMHRNASPFSILKGEWRKIVNWNIDKKGCLTKRKGYSKILNTPDASEVLSIIPFKIGTVRKLIMINKAGKLYVADPVTDSTWGTAKLTGLSTSARWTATVLHDGSGNGVMLLGNGYQTYRTSDASTFTNANSTDGAPLGKYWATFQERVFCAGVPADADVLHWSSIGDATDWSSVSPSDSSSLNVDKHSGGLIQNIKTLNDRVVVWKKELIKRWDEEYLRTVKASHGLDAPYSIAEVDGAAFSLDRDAIRLYDGNAPIEISEKIEDLIFGIDFDDTNRERICGEVFKKKYYLSVGDITDEDSDTISNAWIVYDYNKNAFWLYSLADKATAMTKLMCSDGEQRLYFGDDAGNVYQMFSGQLDDTEEIEAVLEGHLFYPTGPEFVVEPKQITIVSARGHQMKSVLSDGYENERYNLGDNPEPVSQNLISKLGNGVSSLKIEIAHSTKGRPTFYGFTLGYETEGARESIA
jgi:hypothetical protein